MNKFSRKFLVKLLPDLTRYPVIHYERYFLKLDDRLQIRIQSRNDEYELEEVDEHSELERSINKKELTEDEFEEMKQKAVAYINRDSYLVSEKPIISVKVYHDRFEGLIRVEVDFSNKEEAANFIPLKWFGKEITNSSLGKDRKLLKLSKQEFLQAISD